VPLKCLNFTYSLGTVFSVSQNKSGLEEKKDGLPSFSQDQTYCEKNMKNCKQLNHANIHVLQ